MLMFPNDRYLNRALKAREKSIRKANSRFQKFLFDRRPGSRPENAIEIRDNESEFGSIEFTLSPAQESENVDAQAKWVRLSK